GNHGRGIGKRQARVRQENLKLDVRASVAVGDVAAAIVNRTGHGKRRRRRTYRADRRIWGDSTWGRRYRHIVTPRARPDYIRDGSARPSEPPRTVRHGQQAHRLI